MSDIFDDLTAELANRKAKNPKYSVRAFARDLEIDQSLLTKVLKGQRKISRRLEVKIRSKLESDPQEIYYIINDKSKMKKTLDTIKLECDRLNIGFFKDLSSHELANFRKLYSKGEVD